MPRAASSSACFASSVHRELPPSTTTSPSASSPDSSSITDWVAAPAGTISHTARGAASASTISRRLWTSADGVSGAYPTTV